jgi:DNA-binding GntR family transcriptional regulator
VERVPGGGGCSADDLAGMIAERPPSLGEHVRRVLRDEILAGRLSPGQRLTEVDAIARTGVSRTPVREGIRLLEAEGLVVTRRSRGTYVAHQLDADEASVVYACRLELEPFLTALAAERMTPEGLRRVRAVAERFAEAADAGASGTALGQLDADFHVAIYDASESRLVDIFRSYWSKLQIQLSARVYGQERPAEFAREHAEITDALARGKPRLARSAMSRHIRHGRTLLERSYAADEGFPR